MTPERWALIKGAFQGALEVAEAERGCFLAAHLGEDAELMAEVEELLRRHIPSDGEETVGGLAAESRRAGGGNRGG